MTSGELAGATIVFDLDGTLADTAPDLTRVLNATLDIEGLAPLSVETARTMVGQGARELIQRAAAVRGITFSPVRLGELTSAYIELYGRELVRDTKLFPGVEAALDQLAALGAKLSVCTNKRTAYSEQVLQALGVANRFSAIVGADSVDNRKPHPDHYRAAVTRAGGVVRRSVMIGDTTADVAAARAAGAPAAVVSFGYCDVECGKLGADAVLDRFSDVAPACRRLLAARP